ncbi:LysR family transcriptional regulator [Fontimonas sp. SYSU GA230001]|uniref:LysR family transcriptional regulator n=1 Tax=Fontimonas sp. SYSU GA230001 TaxID=3142450 RepID=UPI0032B37A4B
MLHVTIRQLQVFATVARHLSFARAAEALHLTPPAVSMQIRQLESQLGLQVFDRSGANVSLTTAGEYLLVHARRMLGSLKDAENLVARLRRVEAGRVQVGMLGTAKYFLPQLLAGFLKEHPAVELVLIEGNRQQLVELLHRNELDLAIMGRPPRELDTRAEPFGVHPLGIVASPEHRLAQVEQVEPAQLADQPFIVRESGSGTRMVMEEYFSHWHLSPPVVMRLNSNETIKQAVMADLGLGFLSLHTTATEQRLGTLRLLPVEGLPALRHWHVAHIRARTLSPASEALRYYILEQGQGFLARQFGPPPQGVEGAFSHT